MRQGVGLNFLRLSQMWGLSRELDHTGGTASPVGAVLPWGMSNHAVSIGFITLLAATTPVPENNLNILGEHPNAIFLSPWEQKASRFGAELFCQTGAAAVAQHD